MEFCVENDHFSEFVQVSVGDFPACFVNLFDHTGEDLQPSFGRGFRSSLTGICNREDWCSAPRTRYLGEEPVFDGVVLGAVRRVVHHYYLETNSFRKSHEVLFHDVVGTGVGAAAGSMVAYCLFVTDIDPLKCNLLFEAFLNPDGTSLPEMDIVLAEGDKAKVIEWFTKRYGKERVNSLTVGLVELRACSIIKDTVDNILKSKKRFFDVSRIQLGDGETDRRLQDGDTVGIFRFEEPAMRAFLYGIQPVSFEELMAVYALNQMGLSERTNRYIQNRQAWNRKGWRKYAFPGMEQYLEQTYGVTFFPEQVMQLAQLLAGFTPGESDMLRQVMANKQVPEMMNLKEKFLCQGTANGYYPDLLETIWLDWEKLLPHACLKSHAAGATLTAYRMAYLKVHYPAAFMAACLNHNKDNMDEYQSLWNELDDNNYYIFDNNIAND